MKFKLVFIVSVALLLSIQILGKKGSFEGITLGFYDYKKISNEWVSLTTGPLNFTLKVNKSTNPLFTSDLNNMFSVNCLVSAYTNKYKQATIAACKFHLNTSTEDYFVGETFRENSATSGSSQGKMKILAGYGKYKGIKGNCTFKQKYLPENKYTGSVSCDWKK